ncbi:hypothetical protein FB451DRAFT_1183161 [Mycena latifolia]|nr:hypothetical protein FB451DRAFT_1183161 [Mycena latifolia]
MAECSATMALMRDARFYKARYRRALARHRQGRLMEALVDLANVLTAEPMDKAATAAFAKILREHESSGRSRDFLTGMSILEADFPSAHGSAAVPRPVRNKSGSSAIVVPDSSIRIPKDLRAGTCASCKTIKWKREIKTCRGCGTAVYCDEVCQRKHWPTHKKNCIRYDDDDVLAMHLCRNLLDHKYISMHLLIYAMRAIGALHHSNPPYLTVLLVFVKMVPLATGLPARRRLSITNIVTAPLAVFEKDTRDSYVIQLQQTRDTCRMPGAPGVAILVTPKKDRQVDKGRVIIFMQRVVPELVVLATQSVVPIGFQSHSFGTPWNVTSDLDELYCRNAVRSFLVYDIQYHAGEWVVKTHRRKHGHRADSARAALRVRRFGTAAKQEVRESATTSLCFDSLQLGDATELGKECRPKNSKALNVRGNQPEPSPTPLSQASSSYAGGTYKNASIRVRPSHQKRQCVKAGLEFKQAVYRIRWGGTGTSPPSTGLRLADAEWLDSAAIGLRGGAENKWQEEAVRAQSGPALPFVDGCPECIDVEAYTPSMLEAVMQTAETVDVGAAVELDTLVLTLWRKDVMVMGSMGSIADMGGGLADRVGEELDRGSGSGEMGHVLDNTPVLSTGLTNASGMDPKTLENKFWQRIAELTTRSRLDSGG